MFQILYRNRFYIGTHTPRFKNTSKELLVKFKTFQQIFNKSLACLLFVKLVVLVGLWFVLSLIASKLFVIGIAHLILNRSSVKHYSLMTIKMHFIVKSRNYVVKFSWICWYAKVVTAILKQFTYILLSTYAVLVNTIRVAHLFLSASVIYEGNRGFVLYCLRIILCHLITFSDLPVVDI